MNDEQRTKYVYLGYFVHIEIKNIFHRFKGMARAL